MTAYAIDWHSLFVPALAPAEIVLRGSLIYLSLFLFLRFIARRQAGRFGPADLLVIVLIADAAQNGMGKEYTSVTEAILLVLTIFGWDYAVDWLSWRFPALRNVLKAPPLTLIKNGRIVDANMRREMITREDLDSQLRQDGIEAVDEVKVAKLEGDGRLSIIRHTRE